MGGLHPGAADTTAARAATITVVKETMMRCWADVSPRKTLYTICRGKDDKSRYTTRYKKERDEMEDAMEVEVSGV